MAMNLFLTAALTAAIAGQNFYCADIKRQEDYAIVVQQQEEAARLKAEQEKQAQEAKKAEEEKKSAIKNALKPYQVEQNSKLVGYNEAKSWWFKRNSAHQPPTAQMDIAIQNYDAHYLGDVSSKVIYLTFDEGYENGCSSKILDILKANNVKAAFFVTKSYIDSEPELVKRMAEEGHIVGNHSTTHPDMTTLSDAQIKQEIEGCANAYKNLTGKDMPKFFRPPAGVYSIRTLEKTKELGYKTIFWSFAYKDWVTTEQPGAEAAYQNVMTNYHNGSVMLLHAVSESNTQALDRIIKSLKEQGYTFKSLEELP